MCRKDRERCSFLAARRSSKLQKIRFDCKVISANFNAVHANGKINLPTGSEKTWNFFTGGGGARITVTNTFVSFVLSRHYALPIYPATLVSFHRLESYDNGTFEISRYQWMLDAQLPCDENYDISKSAAGRKLQLVDKLSDRYRSRYQRVSALPGRDSDKF